MSMNNNSSKSQTKKDVENPDKTHNGSDRSTMNTSEVEQIAERIESRRAERVPCTFGSRVRFLKDCRRIARGKGYDQPRIHKQDLIEYDRALKCDLKDGKGFFNNPLFHTIGIKSDILCLDQITDRALELLESDKVDTGEWIYYKDFVFDYTKIVSRWPVLRSPLMFASVVVLGWYLFTPLLFCVIMPSSSICAAPDWEGVVDSFYFASTTISTVGYGDLTVDQEPRYRSFIGSLYMLGSMIVAVTTFSAIADASFSPLEKPFHWLFNRFNPGKEQKDLFLYQRIRRIKTVKVTELACEITTFIVIGMIGSQLFIHFDDDTSIEDGTQWTWMTSFYWAVQTATTIGYGDLSQPESLRYFKIFYLMVATVLVGNALGKLGQLKEELEETRRQHAWDRRPISKRMIDEMQAYDHDDKVDQYEFLVSSLVSLGHLDSEKVKHIMDKFREHAGEKGYISLDDAIVDENPNAEQSEVANEYEVLENDVVDQELD